jgi:hypothetical protein
VDWEDVALDDIEGSADKEGVREGVTEGAGDEDMDEVAVVEPSSTTGSVPVICRSYVAASLLPPSKTFVPPS